MDAPDFPLIVGVTGHIRLLEEDTETLRKAVADVLKEIDKAAKGADVLLLDSLAPGADQLVADIARQNHPHWRLGVPLPFDEEAYLKTFADEESRASYRSILTASNNAQVFDLANLYGESDTEDGAGRNARYLDAGLFIGLHSHILIAIWDGEPARGEGGTGQIIEHTLQPPMPQNGSRHDESSSMSGAFVYHVQARDEQSVSEAGAPSGTIQRMLPTAWDATARMNDDPTVLWGSFDRRDLKQMVRPLLRLQRDQRKILKSNGSQIEKSRSDLFPDLQSTSADPCNTNTLHPRTEAIAMRFAETDVLANRTQVGARRFALFRLLALLFGIVVFELTTGLGKINPYILGLYLILVTLVTIVLHRPYHHAERRYLNYRALAEAFRVFCYMDTLGLRDRVRLHPLKSDDEGVDWIAGAIAWCRTRDIIQHGRSNQHVDKACVNVVVEQWVVDQRSYFSRTISRESRTLKRLRIFMLILLVTSFLLTALGIAVFSTTLPFEWTEQETAAWILFFAVSSGIIAGATRAYIDYLGLEEHLNRYTLMKHIYQNEERALLHTLSHSEHPIDESLDRMVALAGQALQENASWLALHRDRALDPSA